MKKDMVGNIIKKGDFVVYGVRSGNSGETHLGIIVDPERPKLKVLTKDYRVIKSWIECEKNDAIFSADSNRKYYWTISRICTLGSTTGLVVLPDELVKDELLLQTIEEARK